MIFKIIYNDRNEKIKAILKRLYIYHPSLKRLNELSKGSPETLIGRSKEFSSLLDGLFINGVDKRTGLGRLIELDEWLITIIHEHPFSSISILDVGGSDGSTAFDLQKHLEESIGIEVKVSILERQLRLQHFKRGFLRYYLTVEEMPHLLQIGPIGLIFEKSKGKMRFVFNPFVRFTKKCLHQFDLKKFLKNKGDILLMSPLVRVNPNLSWIEQDLFQFNESLVGTFDLIRCCNILNLDYFNELKILEALKLLSLYLKPNGLLLVSRSLDNSNGSLLNASIWKRSGNGLVHISDLNNGSEIKGLL
jgi:hypothetical protein